MRTLRAAHADPWTLRKASYAKVATWWSILNAWNLLWRMFRKVTGTVHHVVTAFSLVSLVIAHLARCGVADKNDGPACDRCDAMYHADCLNITELSRYQSATEYRMVWYCECCHDHAKRDKELSLRTEKLWEGIENQNKVFTQDEPSLSDRLSAIEPSVFAWVKKGQVQTRHALYLPSSHPDVIF